MSTGKIRLANVYVQQADTARQQGDVSAAVTHFTKAIEVYKGMATEEPAMWEHVADLIEQVAATYKAAGGPFLPKAEEAFAEAANLRERLVRAQDAEPEAD